MLYRSLGGLVVVIIHSFIVYLLSLRLEKLVYSAGVGTTNQHMCGVGTVDVEGNDIHWISLSSSDYQNDVDCAYEAYTIHNKGVLILRSPDV
jgi:hypothetical protein